MLICIGGVLVLLLVGGFVSVWCCHRCCWKGGGGGGLGTLGGGKIAPMPDGVPPAGTWILPITAAPPGMDGAKGSTFLKNPPLTLNPKP